MLPSRRWTDEEGSASLEFIATGMILLVPLVYLVLAVSAIQAGALAVEGAARQAVRVFVQSESVGDAETSAQRAIEFALADYGISTETVAVSVTCAPNPSHCLTRQGFVTISVAISVPLPLIPPVLDLQVPLSVPLEATATQQVSRFWGSG
jgi:hypothetical protein